MGEQLQWAAYILGAIITTFGAIQVALINRTRTHAKATRDQTENHHSTHPDKVPNLRDNIDVNQVTLVEKLDAILDTQRRQTNKIDRLFSITNNHSDQINEITIERLKHDRDNHHA